MLSRRLSPIAPLQQTSHPNPAFTDRAVLNQNAMQKNTTPTSSDPYWKLRPVPPTPGDEVCSCSQCRQVMLRDSLGNNPLYCVACNGEVFPERIGFDGELAEKIARWRSVYRSLYLLWLDSGEYETWAMERLRDPDGSVNIDGREIVRPLNAHIRAYYWWFNDIGVDGYKPPDDCPVCFGTLTTCDDRQFNKCDRCSIFI